MQNLHLLTGDVAQNAHCQAWSREWVTLNQAVGHFKLTAHTAHLVLKEPLQRLAQLQVHFFRQTAHIVVALDHLAGDVQALDAVGIYGALRQPFSVGNLLRLGVEHLHKVAANDFTLLFRIGHTLKVGKEFLAGINANHIQSQSLIVAEHLLELVFAEHTVVHENTGQVFADSLVEQYAQHARIHTARQTENHTVVAQLRSQFSDGSVNKRRCAPLLATAANINHEIAKQLSALQAVEHFGVELHSPHRVGGAGVGGIFHISGRGNHLAVGRNSRDGVAVAHPHLRIWLKALQQRI